MNERMDATANSPFYYAERGLRTAKNYVGKAVYGSRQDVVLVEKCVSPEELLFPDELLKGP